MNLTVQMSPLDWDSESEPQRLRQNDNSSQSHQLIMATHITAINPMFNGGSRAADKPPAEVAEHKQFNLRSAAKLLALLGSVAVVGGVGFLVGSSGSGDSEGAAAATETTDAATAARAVVSEAFNDDENPFKNLTSEVILDVLAQYEADPLSYVDHFFTAELVQSLLTIKNSEVVDERRALRGDMRRQLQQQSDRDAFDVIDNADYSGAVTDSSGNDRAVVVVQGSKCYIVAEESDSLADWGQNFLLGSADILSINTYSVTSESLCGCRRRRWWWCAEADSCQAKKPLGRGYKGFTNAFNEMREELWARVLSSGCLSANQVIFASYSRGGAIIANLAYVVLKENLIPLSKLSMVTFGSPRALQDSESDELHNRFPQRRLIYKKDPVRLPLFAPFVVPSFNHRNLISPTIYRCRAFPMAGWGSSTLATWSATAAAILGATRTFVS